MNWLIRQSQNNISKRWFKGSAKIEFRRITTGKKIITGTTHRNISTSYGIQTEWRQLWKQLNKFQMFTAAKNTKTAFEYRETFSSFCQTQTGTLVCVTDLSKDCVLVIKFICTTQSKEKLTPVIMGPSICHSNKSSSIKSQSWVELILAKTEEKRTWITYVTIFCPSLATVQLYQYAHTENTLFFFSKFR